MAWLSRVGFLSCMFLMIAVFGCRSENGAPVEGGAAGPDAATVGPVAPDGADAAAPPALERTAKTPQDLLASMVQAYRQAQTYGDHGMLYLLETPPGQKMPVERMRTPYTVAFERPRRARIQVGDATIVSDGQNLIAQTPHIPNQLLRRAAPETLTVSSLFPEPVLAEGASGRGMTAVVSWAPIQTVLLLAGDPLKTLVPSDATLSVLDPRSQAGRPCDRVAVDVPGLGRTVYWIERATSTLLRCEFPLTMLGIAPSEQPRFAFFVDFIDAQLNARPSANAFQFAGPDSLRVVERFEPFGFQTLGKRIESFPMLTLDGAAADLATFRGKPAVAVFWSSQTLPSRPALLDLGRVATRYAGRHEVEFLAINIDRAEQVKDETIRNIATDWGLTVPVYRDPGAEQFMGRLDGQAAPTVVFFNADGVVQGYRIDHEPSEFVHYLAQTIEAILAGVDQNAAIREQYDEERAQYDRMLANAERTSLFRALRPGEPTGEETPSDEEIALGEESDAASEGGPDPIDQLPTVLTTREVYSRPLLLGDGTTPFDHLFSTPTSGLDAVAVDRQDAEYAITALAGGGETKTVRLPVGDTLRARSGLVPVLRVRGAAAPVQDAALLAYELLGEIVYLLDNDLNVVRRLERPKDFGVFDAVLVDLNGDGSAQMVLSDVDGVECITATGASLWRKTMSEGGGLLVPLRRADGGFDVLCTRPYQNVVFNAAGEQVAEFSGGEHFGGIFGARQVVPALLELGDRDAPDLVYVEAIPGTVGDVVLAFDATGRLLWRLRLGPDAAPYAVPRVEQADLLGQGRVSWCVRAVGDRDAVVLLDADGRPLGRVAIPDDVSPAFAGRWNQRPALFGWRKDGTHLVVLTLEPSS